MAYVYVSMSTITKEQVIEMLQTVLDPDLGIDIWTLGLIYAIDIVSQKKINLLMTFTTPLCPMGEQIKQDVKESMRMLGFGEIIITVTFEPAWKPSDELRKALGV